MPVMNHTHTYVKMNSRRRARDNHYFKCAHPKCTHFASRELILGKESICSICHENVIILDREALQRANPRCVKCSNTKQSKQIKAIENLFATQGIDLDGVDKIKNS